MYHTGLLTPPPQHPQLGPWKGKVCLDCKGMVCWYGDWQPYLTKYLLPLIVR